MTTTEGGTPPTQRVGKILRLVREAQHELGNLPRTWIGAASALALEDMLAASEACAARLLADVEGAEGAHARRAEG